MLMPLPERMSWRNPPIVTIILIIINISIFLVFQLKDTESYLKASEFYNESGLVKIELRAYAKWAKINRNYDSIYLDIPDNTEISETVGDYLYSKMKDDDEFLKKLEDRTALSADDDDYEKWRELRQKFEAMRSEAVFYSFGFIPGEKKPITFLTHMFLHGGVSHLVGNMIFLWIIGILLEAGTGNLTFLLLYILGGFASVIGFSFFSEGSMTPLVGASGAISAIMGAFTVIYRMKPVRVFINLGVYIDTVKLPAIIFLPFWLGNEIYSYYSNTGSPVAYMAHASGLAAGAVLGFAARRAGFVRLDVIDEDKEPEKDPCSDLLVKAMNHMARLEIDFAVQSLQKILEINPEHEEAAKKIFEIEKSRRDAEKLHAAAGMYIRIMVKKLADAGRIVEVYDAYVSIVQRPRLDPELYAEIALRMAISGKYDKALGLALGVSKLPADSKSRVPSLMLKIVFVFEKAGLSDKRNQCLETIISSYPDSQAARDAKGLIM
ncbi:rhomboid family intramembrane serine protease [Desulforegula conservatrix]|uniref:rhomboid family intramembrane serine protease n=1 Tax=Desulforegula conservatrix TaxID=153026 RepID=UPI00041AE01B|nr:rhomboid family intramembrane serine protease [Desulforegula conservatrix]